MTDSTTAVATAPMQARAKLLDLMAARYHMEPAAFTNTIRKTVMPAQHTNEEFAAFMMVAHEYGLNPLLKEIHAFPKKGGGIQPIVSIDGWVNLINKQATLDGYKFEWTYGKNNELLSCKCIMYRKDRTHPVEVEEYLIECIRNTEPWKMKHRMLRHKALMQAGRYCFGLTGIIDEDEAEKFANMRDVTPARPSRDEFYDPESSSQVKVEYNAAETDAAAEEYTVADAYERGRKARRDGFEQRAVPPEWRDNPAFQTFLEAWQEGWKTEDAEINSADPSTGEVK